MEERIRPTRSGLFMIELLIAVGVFALCAAVCVGLFVRSEVMSRESADLTRAVAEARNVSECWKASGGDLEKAAELCGGTVTQGMLWIHYNADWSRNPGEEWDGFQVSLLPQLENGCYVGAVQVDRASDSEPMLFWPVVVLEAAS
ncbi:MAG: hypothetical protein IJV43_07430 [Oscillospiraceae bacterium]|nr:hypothetical protein [Oscillospiraceae bacterium]